MWWFIRDGKCFRQRETTQSSDRAGQGDIGKINQYKAISTITLSHTQTHAHLCRVCVVAYTCKHTILYASEMSLY